MCGLDGWVDGWRLLLISLTGGQLEYSILYLLCHGVRERESTLIFSTHSSYSSRSQGPSDYRILVTHGKESLRHTCI